MPETQTKPKVDVKAIMDKARAKVGDVKKSTSTVESKKDDYRVIPGFSKYEVNSKGIVRSVDKKNIQSKKGTGKYQLFNDKKQRPNLSIEQIFALFPVTSTKKEVKESKQKKEVVTEVTEARLKELKADYADIIGADEFNHAKQYRLHLNGLKTQEIMALTGVPYNATKRNIWYYTSGKKKLQ